MKTLATSCCNMTQCLAGPWGRPIRLMNNSKSFRRSLLCAALAFFSWGASALAAAPLELQYHLSVSKPATHFAEIEITAGRVAEPELDFVLPAWAPGRYAIYEFAKNVQEFEARGAQGQKLGCTKLDKQTWRVDARDSAGTVKVRYRVFGNDLTGSFSQIDAAHASLNGASLFMYVAGHKADPIALAVEGPQEWKVFSDFSEVPSERTFRAANYDRLIDTPLELCSACAAGQFTERGRNFRVVVHSFGEHDNDLSKLTASLQEIVRSELAMMPEPDFRHYTFLFHFAPEIPLGDGMEHLNSTSVIVRRALAGGGLDEALELAAHEFFHVWNVKRLRPAGLGPFDYTREQYTKSLWFAEGVTTYYSFVHLYRAGLWTREEFLRRLAEEIRGLEYEPGQKLMSAESSSFHAWFYDRSPQMQETNFANSTISYYNKGAVLGLLLDLELRARTGGRKSLDDLMAAMYQKFYEAPAETYYLPGRGYDEDDILKMLNEVSGSDFTEFFDRCIRGTEPLPYQAVLAAAGLELSIATSPDAPPSLGVLTDSIDEGVKIVAVRPGSAAERAGLSRDDILTAVDTLSLFEASLRERLQMYPPGTEVPLTVQRHGRESRVVVTLDPPFPDQYSIRPAPQATAEQAALREGWLRKTP